MAAAQIHEVAASDVLGLLRSRSGGLTAFEVEARRHEVGPNRLQPPSRWRWLRILAKHFINFFSLLLYLAAIVCFVADAIESGMGMGLLGWALLGVAVLNGLFAFAQEMRAERAMEALRRFLPQRVRVCREGTEREVLADDLVPGDVLLLAEGDRIAADARLVETEDLLVNNAPLTGESRSQPLKTGAAKGRLIDSPNIAFAGCSVLRGNGTAVVFATGHRTELGKIAALSRDVRRPLSPLQRETNRMVRVLTLIAVVMGLIFFAVGVASGRSLWINIVFMLGIIVANVPEGLLPTITLALSMASLRMAKKQVLVKTLEAVESLGAVHVICTDKTGTLTRNELAIAAMVDPIQGLPIQAPTALRPLLKAALIASEVRTGMSPGDSAPHWSGDPIDVALAQRYAELFGPPDAILAETRRHFPFDLAKRREAGVFANGTEVLFAIKGAWESLRPLIGQPILSLIAVTLGIGYFLEGLVTFIWPASTAGFGDKHIFPRDVIHIGPAVVSQEYVWVMVICIVIFLLLTLFFRFHKMGIAMRATADDQMAVQACGIPVTRVFSTSWMFACVVAAIGGVLISSIGSISHGLVDTGLKAFSVVILGGLDSFVGAVVAGPIIGLAESYGGGYLTRFLWAGVRDIIPFLIIIIVMVIKPYGLFGEKRIERI